VKKPLVAIVACSIALLGCQTLQGNKETVGTAGGAVGGGIIGALVCNNKYKLLCGLVGAGVGGFIGNQIGKKLDEADRQRLALETSQALAASAQSSAPRQWSNPETGVKGTVTVKESSVTPVQASVPVLKGRVKVTPPLDLVGETYKVESSALNVRGGPGTDYAPVGSQLSRGEEVHVVGRVQSDPNWMLIAQNGAGSGYVYSKGLKSTGYAVAASDRALPAGAETVSVSAKQQCKVVEQQVTYADNTTDTESVRMCQQGDGSWLIS